MTGIRTGGISFGNLFVSELSALYPRLFITECIVWFYWLQTPISLFTAGYAVGFICNYFLTTFFTFRSKPSSRNAVGFGFSHLINYLLEIGLLNLFLWMGAGELLAPILVMIIVVPINFLILHFVYIYKGRK